MAKKNKTQKAVRESTDIKAELLGKLKAILPEAISEGKVNIDKMRLALGEHIDTASEKFNFSWAGRSGAIQNVLIPSKATLRPATKESIRFDESENIFIEGDNLEAIKLLQKSYFEKVKIIYIDPPYNTGNDLVYHDDFHNSLNNYLEQSGQVDSEGNRLQTNTQASGRFHSDWLNMMYPRLKLAWNLLSHDGVIFVSIDDNEVHHLRMILDEIFGPEYFCGMFPWRKRTAKSDVPFGISQDFEWVLTYTKGSFLAGQAIERKYYKSDDFKEGWRLADLTKQCTRAERPNSFFPLVNPKNKKRYPANPNRVWGITTETFKTYYDKGKIVFPGDYEFLNITIPAFRVFESEDKEKNLKKFNSEEALAPISTLLPSDIGRTEDGTAEIVEIFGAKVFPFPKPTSLIKHLIKIVPEKDCLIMDFFAGSGTTAHAILAQNQEDKGNRRFILVQMPEPFTPQSEAYSAGYKNLADLSKERIRRVIKGYGDSKPIDDGFKVFKLDKSNYVENLFEYDPAKSEKDNQKAFEDYLSKAKDLFSYSKLNERDAIYENIIKEGLNLNAKITEQGIGKNKIIQANDTEREIFMCLEKSITKDAIEALSGKEYRGKTFICLDNALDDSDKANLALNLALKTI
ncbi:MAG TPA: site-specific DNA-methyltransferase [Candidatus Omnitrophota bacterium]|nr:site-specific DNA-methyltransferase [Candidatus Omnitrophota bacterium]HPD85507.1 site-specific DNA-methyltransferase [Candidatus Omnitrophota bacterium]HRZ03992.1 site-specific DNA-methyltransferase [Candidatus Omnitrophota bacterium]